MGYRILMGYRNITTDRAAMDGPARHGAEI
jgi:hypothetical protein